MQRAKDFFKKEPVFVIAFLCAVLSMFLVPPSADYIGYIDFRVLELLFCLMAAVAGMQQEGVFLVLAQKILAGKKSLRLLTLTLVMLPFFSSMLITNDVALITFVPFAVLVLELTGQTKHLAWVVTLQTIAANIGSMLTPVGNPQNLYLSSFYQLAAGDFFAVTIPIVLLSFVLLALCCIAGKNHTIEVQFQKREEIQSKRRLHEALGKLLLAARLQEGLRQAICENMDYGTAEAFQSLFRVVKDNDMLRYASVLRAVATWTGLIANEESKIDRIQEKQLYIIDTYLQDENARAQALRS